MFPFTDDVVQFIVLLTQHGTVEKVRAAISQNPEVAHFAGPLDVYGTDPSVPPGHRNSTTHGNGVSDAKAAAGAGATNDDANDDNDLPQGQSAFFTARTPLVAICELSDDAYGASGGSRIIATADPASFFRSVSFSDDAASEEGTLGATLRGAAGTLRRSSSIGFALNKSKAISCVLLERRDTALGGAGLHPLSVRDLYIQSMDLQKPLNTLQGILQNIYDPMLRSHKTQSALRAQVQDLLTGIRSMHHVLPEIDITRYVHDDLLKLCDANPQLDVPQLIDRLGEPAKDPSFIRRILQVRNRCNEALSMEPLLSGKTEEEELAKKKQNTNSKSYDASNAASAVDAAGSSLTRSGLGAADTSGIAGRGAAVSILAAGYDSDADDDSVWAVQERIVYWQCVGAWMEDVLNQLRGREWRLLHRLLGQRVETDYVAEYVGYIKLVQEYVAFLNTIPEKQLVHVHDMKEFNVVADEILVAATRPTRFSPRLQLSLLTSLVSQIAWRWVSVMETQPVLLVDADAEGDAKSAADGGGGNNNLKESTSAGRFDINTATSSATGAGAAGGDAFDPIASLQTLRVAIHALRTLQTRYVEHSRELRKQIRVVRKPRDHPEHLRVEALLQRCIAVRDFLEGHLLLMRQLGVVFSTQVRLPFASSKSSVSAPQPGEEYALSMQDAYNECVLAVCGARSDGGPLSPQGAAQNHSNFLWRTSSTAVYRFNHAVNTYQQRRNQCDEQIALVVSQLLSNQQHIPIDGRAVLTSGNTNPPTAPPKVPTITSFADSRGLRVFRTYKSFKMLPLERVQSVVQSYQDAMAEKLGAYVTYIQESYVNVHLTKQEVSYNTTRFGVSTLVAQIMWEQRLVEALSDAMVRFDYVSEHGWHQLLFLRNVEHFWRLNSALADFIGVPLNLLACDELRLDSEVHGCAVALACLSLHYADEAKEWGQDEYLRVAQELVETHDPGSLVVARDRILIGGAPRLYKTAARVRDIRSSRDIILQRITTHITSWYEEVDKLVVGSNLDVQTMLLTGPVLWAVNCGPAGVSYVASGGAIAGDFDVYGARDGGANTNNNNASSVTAGAIANANNNGSHLSNNAGFSASRIVSPPPASLSRPRPRSISPSYRGSSAPPGESSLNLPPGTAATAAATSMWMIEVAFPWSLLATAQDLRYLEATQLTPYVLNSLAGGGTMGEMALSGRSGVSISSLSSPHGRGSTAAAGLTLLRDALRNNGLRTRLAHTLVELIHVYYVTVNGEDAALVLVATDEYQEVNRMLQRGMTLRWNDEGVLAYVQQLADTMQTFTTTVQQVRSKTESVYKKIKAFHVRAFHPDTILQRVRALRRIVDALALRCVHAHLWTRQIQPLLEEALLTQMKYLMHSWTEDFQSMRSDVRFLEKGTETDVFRLTPLRIRMRVVYKEVRLECPCSAWRQHWISELNRFLSWVDVLPRLYKQEETQAEVLALDALEGPEASVSSLPSAHRRGNTSSMRPSTGDVNSSLNAASGGGGGGAFSMGGGGGARADGMNRGETGNDGYQYLLMRLPASALAEPLHAIERCVQEAIDTEKEWRRGQQFLNMDVGLMQQRFGGDLHRWSHALGLMHTVTARIMDYTQPNKLLGGIVILAQEAQIELGRKLDQVSQYAHAKFKDLLQVEQERTYKEITQERTTVDALDVISNVRDAAAFLSAVPGLKTKLQKMDGDITLIGDAEASLTKLGHVFPEHWIYAAAVREEYTSLAELVDRKLKAVQVRRPYLLEEARTTTDALEAKIKELDGRFRNLDSDAASKDAPALSKQAVEGIFDEATALDEEAKRITAIQEELGETPHTFSSLQKLLEDVAHVKDVWCHVASAYEELNELGATPFFEMVPRRMHERLQAIEEETEQYPETVKSYKLCKDLVAKVQGVLGYNRLMQDLRSDAMSPLERALRHWTVLQQKLHTPWVLENLRVRDIWDSDPAANATVYNEVIEMAQGERRIEVQLNNITNFWNMFEFSVIAYKKQVVLIRGWEDVLDRLTEDLSTFGGMRASPYFISPQLVSMTNEAEARLDRLRQVLETLLEVQKRWVYLDGIFAGNAEVRAQLPHDTVKFDRTSRELLHILPRPRSSGELPEVRASFFLEDEKLQVTLERLLSQLTAVQRALTSYLDTQRGRFPRFFFVGDDDLLEIMGNSKNPLFLNKHLKKMFTALASFQLDGNAKGATTRLRGFASSEGEELNFEPGPIEFRQRPMHEWLREAEQGVAFTLRESTLRAYMELMSDSTHYAPLWSMDWIRRKPAQVVCLALQLMWTKQQEGLLTAPYHPNVHAAATDAVAPTRAATVSAKSPATASSAVTRSMDGLLVKLAGSVLDHSIEPSARYRCEQLITIAVYQRDVSRSLAARKVTSSFDFDWLSVLRLYVVPVNQHDTNNTDNKSASSAKGLYLSAETVECRMAEAAVYHGFEYIGAYERLVQTPLTDKCYLTLMQALHTRLGGSPIGPAGTGKTETVKALGMQLGRHVLVFNCDDTFDYQAVSRIFLGLCQVGAWGCFDEFNRLEERILSALSLQIQVIQQSLRERKAQVQLNHRAVPLHTNVAIFITMNPGYAGRSKLPGNLKQLFRTVTMTIPDRETIAEVMLFAQGFTTAEALSQKVVPLFRLCEEQFTHQAHYDFGLRALKSVLVAAGDRKRQVMAETGGKAVAASPDVAQEAERTMLLESAIATIAPKLVAQDVGLFYLLLHDFFPGRSLPTLPMAELRDSVASVCAESGLSPAYGWVEKVLQLYHTKLTRHGVMIVGPSGTGKTTAWKVLMAAMVRLEKSLQMHAYVISPKVLSKAELFGTLDVTTREWRDGVLTSILRRIIDAEEQQQIPDDMALASNNDEGNTNYAALGSSIRADKSFLGSAESSGVPDNKLSAPVSPKAGTKPPGILKTAAGSGERTESAPADVVKEHWIIFDGDVDPEWVENLNSVLDDNRLLTLPNGERLPLPRSVRIFFEVQDLRYATPASVSRCGMLWFSEGIVPLSGVLSHTYHQLQELPIVDARGRHLHWNTDADMIGVAGPRRFLTSDCVLSGSYGKTYHEFIIANATQNTLSEAVGSPLPLRHATRTVTIKDQDDFNLNATTTPQTSGYATKEQSPKVGWEGGNAELDLGSTLYGSTAYGAASMYLTTSGGNNANHRSHPDAERIQEIMVSIWAEAFERSGAVVRGLQLVKSPAFRDVCVMELNDLEVIQSILSFLTNGVWRTFEAEQRNDGDIFGSTVVTKIAQRVLSYAIFWGLSSSMNLENRTKLAKELELRPSVDGVAQSMVEVEVNYSTGEWQLIRNRVQETSILAEQVGANDTVITTVDTCRHEDVLSAWLGSGRSAILCGPPGSGKTMSITAVLNNLPEYEVVFLNFSSGTTVTTIMKALEQYCTVHDTARGLVMVPSSGKQLLLFCDEINLPALDRYGTQVVVQLLRQLIERKGFFRARDNTWINVEDVQVVGACNPPTDPGRVPLSQRFLRWAPVLFVDFPSPDSLLTIYTTYCRAILAWNERLCGQVASRLAKAMVAMYRVSQARFTPIQQPHYLYSPRELSRWSRALYEGILTWDDSVKRQLTVSQLVRLAVHEGLRVFSDRLVSAEEQNWTDTAINDCFRENFEEVDAHTFDRPLLFSTLLSRSYTDSPREALRTYVQKRLIAFNEEETVGDLVIYDSMIDHVVRIDRVLRQPLGHLLIAGSSGVGKTVLTKLVAWMRGFSTFTLMVHRNYVLSDFENDLRAVLRRSGCKRERICFLFDESNILQPSFLEYMNALLASGEVPGLFDGEEWSKLMQEVREAVLLNQSYYAMNHSTRGNRGGEALTGSAREGAATMRRSTGRKGNDASLVEGDDATDLLAATLAATTASVTLGMSKNPADDLVDVNSDAELYHWFLTNVREYLHVVLTINPSSGEFTSRTVASPALVNRCTIDWFGDWDLSTLQQVSQERIRSLELLPVSHDTFSSEIEAKNSVVESLCMIHQATQNINHALRVRHANQGSFITPRHFTDCVSHFVAVLREKQKVSNDAVVHLRNGLTKLQQTSQEVSAQQTTLRESEVELEANSQRAQKMLERIVTETDVAKKEKAAAEALEKQLQDEHAKISDEAKRMSVELAEAEPALKEADAALSTVKPEYLREIRAYTTPPPMVKRTLEAVCVLMGERNSSEWETLKNQIRRDDFLASVRTFRPDDIRESAREQVRIMMKDKKFTVEAAYRASKAAGPLMQWVFFQVKYSAIYQRVAPMRAQIEGLIKARDVKLAGLEKAQGEVRAKEASLQQLMAEYQSATSQIGELKKRIETVSAKCSRAQTIVRQLLDERNRWQAEVKSSDSEARTTLGDCIMSAVFLTYTGFYDEYTRERVLIPRWLKCLQSTAIPVREGLSVAEYLSPAAQQLSWEEAGLPKDRLAVDNAAIMNRCRRYLLLIDPTGVAAEFVLHYYADKKITKASFSRPGYSKQLEMAVRFGYPILMEDAEHLDPAVSPLLNGEVRCHGTRYITRIGPHEVDLAPSFSLFLHTRNPNFQPPPDLAGQVCIVNFTVTLSSLQSQCLHYVLLHERPDVDEKRSKLLKTQGEYQLRLRVLEEKLLTHIAESEGSLLDNDALIQSLAELKQEATRIARDIHDSDDSLREIRLVEEQYRPIATVVAQAHFALQRFAELNPYYHYDVRFVLRVLDDALGMLTPPPTPALPAAEVERLHTLTYLIFLLLHRRVVRGMFNEDHLAWAFRLAQLRSAMGTFGATAAVGSCEAATGVNLPTSASSSSVSPEEWEWIMSCLRVTRPGSGSPTTANEAAAAASEDFVALPPVVRRACPTLGSQSRQALAFQLAKPAFKEVRLSFTTQSAAWESVLTSAAPVAVSELQLSSDCFPRGISYVRRMLLLTLLLLNTRRDAFNEAARKLLSAYFSAKEMHASAKVIVEGKRVSGAQGGVLSEEDFFAPQTNDLAEDIMSELSEATPLLMVADTMFDPASRVEELARRTNTTLFVVAMGSMESIESADAYLAQTTKEGGWMLLKNVHLALGYMDKLEKQLHFQRSEQQIHKNFRLFLTAEREGVSSRSAPAVAAAAATASASKVLPINLIETSVMVVYEAPPGMQSSLLQTYGEASSYPSLPSSAADASADPAAATTAAASAQRNSNNNTALQRLYLAAAWLHSVITERISYKPLGWSEAYEYTEVEYQRVVQAVQAWSSTKGSTLTVSWDALRTIVSTTIYGGKVSNVFDQHVLDTFCRRMLNTDVLHDGALLVPKAVTDAASSSPLPPITGHTRSELLQWVRGLEGGNSDPAWLALPVGADRMTRARSAIATVERLSLVQNTLDDELTFADDDVAHMHVGSADEVSGSPLSGKKGGAGTADPSSPTAVNALRATRWAAKVQAYCVAWYPLLFNGLQKLQKNAFVQQAVALHEQETRENVDADLSSTKAANDIINQKGAAKSAVPPPLVMAMQREVVAAVELLRHLTTDIRELREVVMEERTPSSVHRGLVEELMKDHVPAAWGAHLVGVHGSVACSLFVGLWIADVQQRVEHLLALATAASSGAIAKKPVRLGLLFSPGAFLTAFKQQCARADQVPLERLVPQIEMSATPASRTAASPTGASNDPVPRSASEMVFLGLTLYSAVVDSAGKCALTSTTKVNGEAGMPALSTTVSLRWKWVSSSANGIGGSDSAASPVVRIAQQRNQQGTILLPFYTTDNRESLLEVLDVPIAPDRASAELGISVWYERGVCLAAWAASD
ncbi:dynein heavy chain cytosolic putativee [Leptomonas pyrrhocoris]|uniref:Dynein heavy chain cytosolic putativee n=1 Tax=Leptomonas pyrrhocoris TaxID=157538 RepID=A0A0N0DZW1_LEPPY|nr:dynein heavy chain cytosolic putativee [Leptomonas pyrrhocoris]XP_015664190.1 dynein heavy chain cytosolic putativee [Leptomonas pyrrhocoris]KPA85750.1 dynein heavy chain cytosolic putativee [Leptomonas pyrrhocoris]KPA85751.1 dynein heavy chain cytosolic putativee [Leptomonas pyrrhocoris]|eukprot:XP_015664189.1 dynein heavy chain cytosolic putativee [Leptomonas pyrrhocoris]